VPVVLEFAANIEVHIELKKERIKKEFIAKADNP